MFDFKRLRLSAKTCLTAAAVVATMALVICTVHTCRRGEVIVGQDELVALDPQNAGINIEVTRPWLSHDAVFNVKKPDDRDFNRLDVMRVMLQCAQSMRGTRVDKLYLANDGTRVYYLQGDYFKRLGSLYAKDDSWNNMKLCIELPQNTHTLNDSLAVKPHDGFLGSIQALSDWNDIMDTLLK